MDYKSDDRILLFIPMYNCEKQIVRVLAQLTLKVCGYLSEVIIVNNRSTDNGEQAVADFLRENPLPIPVRLLRNHENYSLGGSHKVAFQYAIEHGFDYVIVLHGDDQGSIRDIMPVIRRGRHRGYDSLLGSRFLKHSHLVNYSRFRIFGNRVFNALLTLVTGRRVHDLGSGLNMYNTDYLRDGFYMTFPNNLNFNIYMLLYGIQSGSRFAFFPLTWREEDQVSNAKFLKQSLELLGLAGRYLLARKELFSGADNEWSRIDYAYDVIYEDEGWEKA